MNDEDKSIGIKVGADKAAVDAAIDGIMKILGSGAEQKTLRAALQAFTKVCSTDGTLISNNSISVGNRTAPLS